MKNEQISRIIFEAIGEVSAIFMSQEVKGTEIVMPTEGLKKIGDRVTRELKELVR